jgi:hypothetical protein
LSLLSKLPQFQRHEGCVSSKFNSTVLLSSSITNKHTNCLSGQKEEPSYICRTFVRQFERGQLMEEVSVKSWSSSQNLRGTTRVRIPLREPSMSLLEADTIITGASLRTLHANSTSSLLRPGTFRNCSTKLRRFLFNSFARPPDGIPDPCRVPRVVSRNGACDQPSLLLHMGFHSNFWSDSPHNVAV